MKKEIENQFKVGERVIIKGDCYKALNNQSGIILRDDKLKVLLDNGIKCWPMPKFVFPHKDNI